MSWTEQAKLRNRLTEHTRFVDRIIVGGPTGCWLWDGGLAGDGYGQFRRANGGPLAKAHRYAYELFVGPIPEGLTLDHLCRNRACVNPAHLEPVTLAENKARGESFAAQNARKTHCPRGHAYTPANTKTRRPGWRECRECDRARKRVGS